MAHSALDAKSLSADTRPQTHLRSDISEMRERMAAVIAATHDAAMMIISTVENTFEAQGDALSPALQESLFSVLSACAFQDIAGQHLARMTELLNDIQHTTLEATAAGGAPGPDQRHARAQRRAARLTNGPAIAGDGLGQNDVDSLFGSASDS